ncbi:vWA domain-containing protein [Leucobacter sp. HY1908]
MHSNFSPDHSRHSVKRTSRSSLLAALWALPLLLGLLGMNVPDAADAVPGSQGTDGVQATQGASAPDHAERDGAGDSAPDQGPSGTGADGVASEDALADSNDSAEPLAATEPMDVEWEESPTAAANTEGTSRAVPVPDKAANESVIMVKVGGDRAANVPTGVAPLEGIKLRLHTKTANNWMDQPILESWATCTSDADGHCSFIVPETGVGEKNHSTRLVIAQIESDAVGANGGWYANPIIRTGKDNKPNFEQRYEFLTPKRLFPGRTYESGRVDYPAGWDDDDSRFMDGAPVGTGAVPQRNSLGVWQNSRKNSDLGCRVGLNVALVLDLSRSIDNPDPITKKSNLPRLKSAATGFLDALSGTGSSVGVFTFADLAPASTAANYPLAPVDDATHLANMTKRINGYKTAVGTNWDQGLYQVVTDANQFDLAIVVTDGLPTLHGTKPYGLTQATRISEVEASIYSANALKAKGTRVIAVGVGDIVKGSPVNLAAISGQQEFKTGVKVEDADYFTTEWEHLAERLGEIARQTQCAAEITVKKEVRGFGQREFTPARAGWNFDLDSGVDAKFESTGSNEASNVTDSTGSFTQTVRFVDEAQDSTNISITERLTAGQADAKWKLTGVSCETNGGAAVQQPITDMGVTVPASKDDKIICTFQNEQVGEPSITLVKRGWATDDTDTINTPGRETATEIAKGETIKDGTKVSWSYDVTNTGETDINDLNLVDNRLAAGSVDCPATTLAAGATMRCTATGPVRITSG